MLHINNLLTDITVTSHMQHATLCQQKRTKPEVKGGRLVLAFRFREVPGVASFSYAAQTCVLRALICFVCPRKTIEPVTLFSRSALQMPIP